MKICFFPRIRPQGLRLALVTTLVSLSFSAAAADLLAAYRAALQSDPIYQAALSERSAGLLNRDIARSNLLPSASATGGYSENRGDRSFNGSKPDPLNYDSKVLSVSVRQPLYSMDAMARYRQGGYQADYAEAIFVGKSQDLILRLVTAYLDVLSAIDQQRLILAQRDALAEQQQFNTRRYEKGEGIKTDVLETRARFELANATVIEAQDTLDNAQRKLQAIVGREFVVGEFVVSRGLTLPLQVDTAEAWEKLALERNPDIIARRQLVEIATQEIKKNQAGHLPRLDLVASYSRSLSESVALINSETNLTTVGVQLNVPIYSGGAVSASIQQSAQLMSKSQSERDDTTNAALVEIRKQFNLVASSRARIQALEQAEGSAQETLEATRKSIQSGVRINLDLLNALQQFYTTQRDLAQARYGYLLAYVRLHDSAGLLDEAAVGQLSTLFRPN
jgi:protease secretion system outer membrane protein